MPKPIKERISDALKGGPLPYQKLARLVFPQEDYPRAWNYGAGGGPPGCYMALSAAIDRHGFSSSYDHDGCRHMVHPQRNKS